jgi:hypothetical protein
MGSILLRELEPSGRVVTAQLESTPCTNAGEPCGGADRPTSQGPEIPGLTSDVPRVTEGLLQKQIGRTALAAGTVRI